MKRILILCLMTLCALITWAYDFEVAGLYYEIVSENQNTCGVTYQFRSEENCDTYKGEVIIPESIEYENKTYKVTCIYNEAFAYCHELTSVILPETITDIYAYAFWYCNNLTSIDIPNSVTNLQSAAFEGCSLLKNVNLSNAITHLSGGLFTDCISLEEISIPNSVTEIESYVFSGCISLKEIVISDYVTELSVSVFRNCTSLKKAVIGNNIDCLKQYVFRGCTSLEDVTIGTGVVELCPYVFTDCTSLKEIIIPNSVITLDAYVFENCTSLEDVTIGSATKSIQSCCFQDSPLKKVSSLNPTPPSCSETNVFKKKDSECVLYVPAGSKEDYAVAGTWKDFYKIEELVSEVANYDMEVDGIYYNIVSTEEKTVEVTWGGESVSSGTDSYEGAIIIPDNVTHENDIYTVIGVGEHAFHNCYELTSVTIPNSVSYIDSYAFRSTTRLSAIDLGMGVESIAPQAFRASGLTELTIPDNITYIGTYAFEGCTNLTILTIGSGLTNIEEYAFSGTGIERLTIPTNVISIGAYAFKDCEDLASIDLGNGVTSLGDYVFSGTGIEDINIPNSVSSLGSYIVKDCKMLKHINVDATTIGEYAFSEAVLEDITIGENVKTICAWACYNCKSLTSLSIPDNVTSIERNAFRNCEVLETVTIGKGITTCGDFIFQNCYALTNVSLPESLTSLSQGMFYLCSALEEITIPARVTEINNNALGSCHSLSKIYALPIEAPTPLSEPFKNINPSDCTLYVSMGSKDSYASTQKWKDFYEIIEIIELSISTAEATNITKNSATLGASLTEGNVPIKEKGFEYWTEVGKPMIVIVDDDEMIVDITELEANTIYNYHAYATTAVGTTYGEDVEFKTLLDTDLLYESLKEELYEACDLLKEIWGIITSECSDVEDQFEEDYTALVEELESLLEELEDAYNNGILTEELGEEIRAKINEIVRQIAELLVAAQEAHNVAAGIDDMSIDDMSVKGYYTITGQKLDRATDGVNIVKCSDGTTKKILIK